MIASVANSLGDTVVHDNNMPGGTTAQGHSNNATTISKISQSGWDYVVLQFQSQEPAFAPAQVLNDTYPYVKSLDSLVDATNTCAEVMYYMTWGRKNGDATNCPFYPPVCTYDGMQQRLRESYLLFADDFNSSVSPVGAAWKMMRDSFPTISLYDADESHPSINGTYLAACVFYCSLFKKSCVGSQYLPGGVGNGDAFVMQQIANHVVLDSLENWQGEGNIPDAAFVGGTFPGSGSAAIFTNQSKRYTQSAWNFGDGSPIDNNTNPSHNFPNAIATYTVCLEVTSTCGKKDSICKTLMVNPSSTSDFSATDKITIGQGDEQIFITNDFGKCTASLLNINGTEIYKVNLEKGKANFPITQFAKGIYILKINSAKNILLVQKVLNN